LRAIGLTLLSCLVCFLARAESNSDLQHQFQSQVFKVNADRQNGTTSVGSAVMVGAGKLVTNCHVIRWAKRIELTQDERRWAAQLALEDTEHDLCVLTAQGLSEAASALFGPDHPKVGDEVYAAGFPGGKQFCVSSGRVKALHAHDDAKVIQTNAPFSPGASGGGLFDAQGRLLGVLTFRAVSGGDFHFVMPAQWIKRLLEADPPLHAKSGDRAAFWERSFAQQPYFLRAAAFEEGQKWTSLLRLAKRWTQTEIGQPESWMAVGKACAGLKRYEEAAMAFRRVLSLNPEHAEGQERWNAITQDGKVEPAVCARDSWCDVPLQPAPNELAAAELVP
jgi:serine protease Do